VPQTQLVSVIGVCQFTNLLTIKKFKMKKNLLKCFYSNKSSVKLVSLPRIVSIHYIILTLILGASLLSSLTISAQSYEVPTGPFIQLNQYVPPIPLNNVNPNSKVTGLVLPITHYQQCNQSAWSGNPYGSGSCSTICVNGCALCCGAMMLQLDGVNANPGQVNSWLQSNSGYSGCDVKWSGTQSIDAYPGNIMTWYGSVAYSLTVLKSEIDAGNPVIAKVNHRYGGSGTCGHFVTIYGYNGTGSYASDFLVADPGTSTFPTNWSYYTLCSSTTTPLRIYHNVAPVQCATPYSVYASSITPTTAVLNWISPNALSYNYFLKKSTVSSYTVYSNYTYKPVQFSNLLPSTAYNFKVSSNCSSSTSLQSSTYTFTTPALLVSNGSSGAIIISDGSTVLGISEIAEKLNEIVLFPNPVKSGEEIFISGIQKIISVELYSADSKIIFSKKDSSDPLRIPSRTFPGIYFLKIIDANKNQSFHKIIIQ
jgi:hypothetical protein